MKKVLKITGITIGCLLLAVAAGITFLFFWATPERLSRLVDKEGSEYLYADLHTSGIRFSIISTFPSLQVETDSLSLTSRVLQDISPDIRAQLPADADFLMSAQNVGASVNVLKLLKGEVAIGDVTADGVRINMTAVNDTLANYNIIPEKARKNLRLPSLSADTIKVGAPVTVRYFNLASSADVNAVINEIRICRDQDGKDRYRIATGGVVSANMKGMRMVERFPFHTDGDVTVSFNPFAATLIGYAFNLGNINGVVDMSIETGDNPRISNLSVDIDRFNPLETLSFFPLVSPRKVLPSDLEAATSLTASAVLRTPYAFGQTEIPSFDLRFSIPEGKLSYKSGKKSRYSIDALSLDGELNYDSNNPESSRLRIDRLTAKGEGINLNLKGAISDITGEQKVKATLDIKGNLTSASHLLPAISQYKAKGDVACKAEINTDLKSILSGNVKGSATMNCGIKGLALSDGETKGSCESLTIGAKIATTPKGKRTHTHHTRPYAVNSRDNLTGIRHTPEYIVMTSIPGLRSILDSYTGHVDLKLKDATVSVPSYPADTKISSLDIRVTTDSVKIRNLAVSNRSTKMRMNGSVGNLYGFLTSTTPVEIPVALNVRLDTININQLAGTYERGLASAGKSVSPEPAETNTAPLSSDSIAMLIPRNVRADITASAKETIYSNLRLYDLATKVHVEDGNALVDTLTINSDFGNAYLKFLYKTSDIQDMRMSASVGVLDINVVNFFENFHALLEMMPQMKNLTGMLSGRLSGSVRLFPTMYADVPSLRASIGVEGWNLKVHQNEFIRRVTRMMMIPNSNDIHIQDLSVKATVHDNLLELYPFDFNFNKYSLEMAGVNNFDGDLYYHIGVKDSPLHFPFGINVEGHFDHPDLRFGGARYKPDQAEKITSDIMMVDNMNVTQELRHYLREFIHHAALSDTLPSAGS